MALVATTVTLAVSHALPDSGSFSGDAVAVAVAIAAFVLLYWTISLFDRI